jgi:hypothetical protein
MPVTCYASLSALDPNHKDMLLRNNKNAIYTFDYFLPQAWVFGESKIPSYPGTYTCGTLNDG